MYPHYVHNSFNGFSFPWFCHLLVFFWLVNSGGSGCIYWNLGRLYVDVNRNDDDDEMGVSDRFTFFSSFITFFLDRIFFVGFFSVPLELRWWWWWWWWYFVYVVCVCMCVVYGNKGDECKKKCVCVSVYYWFQNHQELMIIIVWVFWNSWNIHSIYLYIYVVSVKIFFFMLIIGCFNTDDCNSYIFIIIFLCVCVCVCVLTKKKNLLYDYSVDRPRL